MRVGAARVGSKRRGRRFSFEGVGVDDADATATFLAPLPDIDHVWLAFDTTEFPLASAAVQLHNLAAKAVRSACVCACVEGGGGEQCGTEAHQLPHTGIRSLRTAVQTMQAKAAASNSSGSTTTALPS